MAAEGDRLYEQQMKRTIGSKELERRRAKRERAFQQSTKLSEKQSNRIEKPETNDEKQEKSKGLHSKSEEHHSNELFFELESALNRLLPTVGVWWKQVKFQFIS